MRIEGMCLVCHGPLTRTQKAVTAIVCTDDGGKCRARVRDIRRARVKGLAHKYSAMRALHAYRREMEAVYARLAAVLTPGGWLEVG